MGASYLIVGATVFDGSGADPEPKEVLVEGNRITAVEDHVGPDQRSGAEVIDGTGATLMPGLTEGHAHIGFGSTVEYTSDRHEADEDKVIINTHCARVLLDHGFTSAFSGGNRTPLAELATRRCIERGMIAGPRLRCSSWEGSAGIISPDHPMFPGTADRDEDPAAMYEFVNAMADIGVDQVKLTLTGESQVIESTSRILQFTEDEVAAAAKAASERGISLTAHAHSAEAVMMGVKCGIRAIYHVSFADDEAIAALAGARDRVFVAPTPGILWAHLNDPKGPPTDGMETVEMIAGVRRAAPELHRQGVRLVIGGDYGFPLHPIGKNAKDLELFVDWFGLTPAQALQCATQNGGELMGMGDELGLIQPGYLADMLLVDGDPLDDIRILQDKDNLAMIMKDGGLHKLDPARQAVTA